MNHYLPALDLDVSLDDIRLQVPIIGFYQKKQVGIDFYRCLIAINLASGVSSAQLKAQWLAIVGKFVCYCE